jgi:MoaA/NifB/PqqE/SkfB family radical SAM enzyme
MKKMIACGRQWLRNRCGGTVRPLELIVFVTGRCTFRCQHCFIRGFETDAGQDLPVDAVERLAASLPDLLVLMLTGGEPFLRADLPQVVEVFARRSTPRVISIATNGFLSDQIPGRVEEILERIGRRSQLVVTLSIDGNTEVHNRLRGNSLAYDHALKTAHSLRKLAERHPHLAIGANLTLTTSNSAGVVGAARDLARMNLFDFLTQNIYRDGKPCRPCAEIDPSTYRQLSDAVLSYSISFRMGSAWLGRWNRWKEEYQARLVEKMCRQQAWVGLPCEAGRGIGVIYADGRVAPCELLPPDWGNVRDRSFVEIWNDPVNRARATGLRRDRCFCTHECFVSASLNLQVLHLLRCLAHRARRLV